ncbi:hypothetical protein QQZ08_011492 [Neonectria magnoliae]|uniref:Uncharacterized protein n=1 Tax=Neonectria magnoliae TaxID=2732573 RepID=A0ABR1HB53_9HYPO
MNSLGTSAGIKECPKADQGTVQLFCTRNEEDQGINQCYNGGEHEANDYDCSWSRIDAYTEEIKSIDFNDISDNIDKPFVSVRTLKLRGFNQVFQPYRVELYSGRR